MISIKDFLEAIDYKITGGSEFGWSCFGPNARWLDCHPGNNASNCSIVFDSVTQIVYLAEVDDYRKNNSYRLIHPDFKDAHTAEAESRNVRVNQAYDDVDYIILESDADYLEKTKAIMNGENYDDRVIIELDLDQDDQYNLMLLAHQADMTFNDFLAQVLHEQIKRMDSDPTFVDEVRKGLQDKYGKKI